MSQLGVVAIDRGIFGHDLFETDEPFTRREAWIWLIVEAAWKDRTKRVDGKTVAVKRGQVAHSIRFMAEAWGWHRTRVDRFLRELKIETMIETETETGITIITICNYDEYQRVSLPDRDKKRPADETLARHERDKLEDIKNIKSPSLRSGEGATEKRSTRLPDDWKPSEADVETAVASIGCQRVPAEIDKFRDYWRAKPGSGGKKLDWDATWRNWIRRAAEDSAARGPPVFRALSGVGQTHGGSNGNLIDAAERLQKSGFQLGPRPSGYRGEQGESVVRLLPKG